MNPREDKIISDIMLELTTNQCPWSNWSGQWISGGRFFVQYNVL